MSEDKPKEVEKVLPQAAQQVVDRVIDKLVRIVISD
jgi:cation transport regulator ChaB